MPLGVAIVGSGIFAREQHLPAVEAAKDLQLKAIYSRSLTSAQQLAGESTVAGLDLYADDSRPGRSYGDLLARQDISAVIICLPILVQPEFIKQALTAGKHVLSEKPIAKDLATAQELVQWYHATIDTHCTLWAVAENYRFFTKFLLAAEQVQKLGRVRNFRVNEHTLVPPESKYYNTAWRKNPQYQGGFLLDGGVHTVAGLRLILGANDPVVSLSAHTSLQQEHLPPVDTVDAVMKTRSGATGVLSMSFGSAFKDSTLEFSCEGGIVTLTFDGVFVNGVDQNIPFDGKGVVTEVAAFAAAIGRGEALDPRQSLEEALADLEILEKMLVSGGEKMTITG